MFIMAPRAKQPSPTEPPVRRNRAAAVGTDAGLVGHTAFERAGFGDATLVLRWHEIVGGEVARLARPFRLKDGPDGGVLTLAADPAAAVFLQHESRSLCDRINTYLGRRAVTRLRFVPARPITSGKPSAPRKTKAELPPEDPARTFQGAEELKGALLRLARQRRGSITNARD